MDCTSLPNVDIVACVDGSCAIGKYGLWPLAPLGSMLTPVGNACRIVRSRFHLQRCEQHLCFVVNDRLGDAMTAGYGSFVRG